MPATTLASASLLSYGVVALAEMGDKSQLVCMTLAARHRARPVLFGAIAAFALLNLLAVTLGAGLAQWIPTEYLAWAAAAMFALFGIQALRGEDDEDDEDEIKTASRRSLVLTTFLMIFLAELGDKTQLAVAAMGTTNPPVGVYLGATLALATTTVLGVYAGRKWLARMSGDWLRRGSGLFFLAMAVLAASQAI